MLEGLSASEMQDLLLSIGTHKTNRRLKPTKVAELLALALRHESIDNVARELELAEPSTLRRFLCLRDLPESIQPLITWGSQTGYLSFSVASEISRLREFGHDAMLEASRSALEHSFAKEEMRSIVQRALRGHVSVSEATQEILSSRPIIEKQYVFIGRRPSFQIFGEPTKDCRSTLRKLLAAKVGATNLLSASCSENTVTFIVSEDGFQRLKQDNLTPQSIDRWLEALCQEGIKHVGP